jgi:RHS repeat-associated protein
VYKYGFNGQEKDDEVYGNGNIYDYGFRVYDPRLGRFLSVDPLTMSYPWYTPYQFAGNKPILFIDLDGKEETLPSKPGEDCFLCDIVNEVINAGDNVIATGLEWSIPDKTEGALIRKRLEKDGYKVPGLISNEKLGQAFSIRFINRIPVVVPDGGVKGDLIDLSINTLVLIGSVPTEGSMGSVGVMVISTKSIVTSSIASMLRGLKILAREKEITETFLDAGTGKLVRAAEANGAAIFEETTGSTLRASLKGEKGDFIATSGKYEGRSIDHFTGWIPGKNNMVSTLKSLDKHMGDGKCDYLLIDMRKYSKTEYDQIMNHLNTKYSDKLSKVLIIE